MCSHTPDEQGKGTESERAVVARGGGGEMMLLLVVRTAAKLLWLACTPASSLECVMLLAVARRPGNLAQQAWSRRKAMISERHHPRKRGSK